MSLDRREIEKIENLEHCTHLACLYLSENLIQSIGAAFTGHSFKMLESLSLDDNHIHKIEGLEVLVHLKKLDLEKNCISRLEGLHNCRALEELYLSKQILPDFVEFTFDEERTMPALAVRIMNE